MWSNIVKLVLGCDNDVPDNSGGGSKTIVEPGRGICAKIDQLVMDRGEEKAIQLFWKTYKWEFTVVTKEDLKNSKIFLVLLSCVKYE